MSIAGGIDRAVERAVAAGCEALQVFTRSASQWASRPLPDDECQRFRSSAEAAGLQPVLAHDSYLINVASPDATLRERSLAALDEEFARCTALGIPYLVMHPGAHMGAGEDAGIRHVAEALDVLHERHPAGGAMVLLENTAGQGTSLGWRFEHLAAIVDRAAAPERIGVCIDTAHTFAAGYDLTTDAGWEATWAAAGALLGWSRIRALHVNDSKKPLGSRVDRHEQIALGLLGPAPFWRLANDPRFDGLPASLETEKGEDLAEDVQNLAVLRRMVGRVAPPTRRQVGAWRAAALERRRPVRGTPGRRR